MKYLQAICCFLAGYCTVAFGFVLMHFCTRDDWNFPPHSIWFYIILIITSMIAMGVFMAGEDILNEIERERK